MNRFLPQKDLLMRENANDQKQRTKDKGPLPCKQSFSKDQRPNQIVYVYNFEVSSSIDLLDEQH